MLHPWQMQRFVWQKKLVFLAGWRKMLDQAAFIHVLNQEELNIVGAYGFRAAAEVFPNGVFMEQLEPKPVAGAFRSEHPEVGDRPFILFLGRLHYQKGLIYLADAFYLFANRVDNVDLVVVGPDGGQRNEFENKIEQYGLRSRVHVIGPLYGADKYKAYCDADCFCLPSLNEGFSMAILEAMACRLPVVISKNCFFDEVQACRAGVVVDLTSDSIAAGIESVMSEKDKKERMGLAAYQLVARKYTWQVIAKEMVNKYETKLQ
jgi:glycosyltransferase involved in cell wall biosynthesis